ncbi:MAG: Ppx/GppA family phosphatase [Nitrospinae bacterium]|nr:Ppx/GppA family phosphatase [Nitrospinota bacterium]
MNKIASIDIGSNTVRLLILESTGNKEFKLLVSKRNITRLGENMDTQGKLIEKRIAATLQVLAEFRKICLEHGDPPLFAVATSAVREASNGQEFVRRAKKETGIDIKIISWEEEARLTLEGVFWKIPHENRKIITFDIGGGSTEFILSEGKTISGFCSTSLGVVRLTEKFITQHPVDVNEFKGLENHLRNELLTVKKQLSAFPPEVLIGTAGTVTTLAAIKNNIYPYDPEKIHGSTFSLQEAESILEDLKKQSLNERLSSKPLERGREDLIIAGIAIVLETMRAFDCEILKVSEYSLREGIILRAINEI